MQIRILLTALVLACGFIAAAPSFAREEGIAAIVNEDAITITDVEDRSRLIIASSNLPDTPEIRSKVRPQVVNALIEEQLKLQEAQRLGLDIDQKEIEQGFAAIAQQNKMSPEQFKGMVLKTGLSISTMYRQIEAQIAWTKIVQQEMRPKVTVTDKDIDDFLERLRAGKGLTEYLVAEILLPVEDAKGDSETRQLAEKLVTEIRTSKTTFGDVARQFSKAAGAEQGGDLGWVQQSQLDPELSQVLKTMNKNDISAPIRTTRGYHLLMVRDMRSITDETLPPREKVFSIVGLQRLDRLQRRYYMDLRAAAFIENRAAS